jgi:O-antigen/teichoic acid export membrane protein
MTVIEMGLIALAIGAVYALCLAWYICREDKTKKTKWRDEK